MGCREKVDAGLYSEVISVAFSSLAKDAAVRRLFSARVRINPRGSSGILTWKRSWLVILESRSGERKDLLDERKRNVYSEFDFSQGNLQLEISMFLR